MEVVASLGKEALIMFDISSVILAYHISDLISVIILGVIGVFGGLYNYLLDKVTRVYNLIDEYASQHLLFFIFV